MTEESIFGLPLESPEDEVVEETIEAEGTTSESAEIEETPAEGPPAEEAAPEAVSTPVEETSAVQAEAPEGEVSEPVEGETPAETEARLWANKFQNPEELERGYNESREMWRRANEARKAEAQRAMELQEQYGQLYRQMEGVIPVLQQAAQREAAYRQYAEAYKEQ